MHLTTDDERALERQLAAGDRAAAERLAELTYRRIYGCLLGMCGDAELAADLTQETYRRAWRGLPGFRGECRFSTWLYRIAHTTYLNQRRAPRRLVVFEDAALTRLQGHAGHGGAERIDGEWLRRSVLALPDPLRAMVAAHYWGDMPVREIARQERVSSVAIRKRLKKALAILAGAMGRDAR